MVGFAWFGFKLVLIKTGRLIAEGEKMTRKRYAR
jgi:hypothetical protein